MPNVIYDEKDPSTWITTVEALKSYNKWGFRGKNRQEIYDWLNETGIKKCAFCYHFNCLNLTVGVTVCSCPLQDPHSICSKEFDSIDQMLMNANKKGTDDKPNLSCIKVAEFNKLAEIIQTRIGKVPTRKEG